MTTYRGPYVSSRTRGRSPYSSAVGQRSLTDRDFEYVGPDYPGRPPAREYHSRDAAMPRRTGYNEEEMPDVIYIRHMNKRHELPFKAFVISDGVLRIADIRTFAAETLGAPDPARVRLLYKGKQLKNDNRAAKDYGIKQESEIMAVVSETPPSRPNSDSEPEESTMPSSRIPRRDRSSKRKPKNQTTPNLAPPSDTSGFSPRDEPGRGSRAHSPYHRPPPPHSPPGQPLLSSSHSPSGPSPSSPSPAVASPILDTPVKKVEQLASTFHTQWVPKCVQFLMHPPPEAKVREQEHKRLSESILDNIMLKADNIDLEGDAEARAQRKTLLNEVNGMFKKLDGAVKGQPS